MAVSTRACDWRWRCDGIHLQSFCNRYMSVLVFDLDNQHEGELGCCQLVKRDKAKIKTVITFDKGGIWSYLDAPKFDARGKRTNCKGGGDSGCHLHLHGITDAFGPFYSLQSATGIIMATGSLGNHLHDRLGEINTYLSRDAGLTWKEVAKGSHIYEYGDHGGLIVMAFDE
eukprot:176601-Amorphochlora_amoeboformis.AAC.1